MQKLLLLACLALAPLAPAGAADLPESIANQLRHVTNAMVGVDYELQPDQADPPRLGFGHQQERLGDHRALGYGDDASGYVAAERPVEQSGFLIGSNLVVSADELIPTRFIKSVQIRFRGQKVPATIIGQALDQRAVYLKLEQPLPGAVPLPFTPGLPGPYVSADLAWDAGEWLPALMPQSAAICLTRNGRAIRWGSLEGIMLASNGTPVGISLTSRLPLDASWHGSPERWPRLGTGELDGRLKELGAATRRGLVRVTLNFRSPKTAQAGASRFDRDEDDTDGNSPSAVRNVLGWVMPGNRVLVLARLSPKTTARLEHIVINPAEGDPVEARFTASLKHFGAFVVTPKTPLDGALAASDADLHGLLEKLILRSIVELQGETRTEHLQTARLYSMTLGRGGELYPAAPGVDLDGTFLFGLDRRVIAVPVSERQPVASQRRGFRDMDREELVPAQVLIRAVNGLPATGDPANVPVSEADENRLAWLGVELQPLTPDLARANNVSDRTRDGETGALVTYVHPDSPAARAGITVGAVLLRLKVPGQAQPIEVHLQEDYSRARSFPWERLGEVREQFFDRIPLPWPPVENDFTRALTDLGFGTKYTAEWFADGKLNSREFEVIPGPAHYESAPRYKSDALGLTVRDLTYDVRRYMQMKPDAPGVVVSKVEAGGKCSVAGLKPYELITHINDQPVSTVKDFEKLAVPGTELKFSVKRMSMGRIVTVQAPKAP